MSLAALVLDPGVAPPEVESHRSPVPQYLVATAQLLARSGLRADLRTDLARWADHLAAAPGNTGLNPTFNPACHSRIDPETAFWIALVDRKGSVAACMACRLFVTTSYYDLMRTGRLWYTADRIAPINLLLDGTGPVGRVSHSGGLWVHPDCRGSGLSWVLPRLVGATALEAWSIDFHTGIVFAGLNAKRVPDRNYGVSRNLVAIDGYFPPTDRREVIYSVETPSIDILNRTATDVAEILRHPDKEVRDFAPIAKQRSNETPVNQPARPEVS